MNKAVITLKEYQGFQRAYDFFNRELFGGSLPQVLVTLQRHANTRGYFSPERFKGRVEKAAVHELALNPDTFTGRSDELILSTLTHEMCHVWQETYGEPSRRGYHNRQWASKMREVGLQPTSTGEPGGMETGQAVTHYIIPEGLYAKAYAQLSACKRSRGTIRTMFGALLTMFPRALDTSLAPNLPRDHCHPCGMQST
jgi:hypothetical protein